MNADFDPGARRHEVATQDTINALAAEVRGHFKPDDQSDYARLRGHLDGVPTLFGLTAFSSRVTNTHGARYLITTLPDDKVSEFGKHETSYNFIPDPDTGKLKLRRYLPFDYSAAEAELRKTHRFDVAGGIDQDALHAAIEQRRADALQQEERMGLHIVDAATAQSLLTAVRAAKQHINFMQAMDHSRRHNRAATPPPFWRRGWLGRLLRRLE